MVTQHRLAGVFLVLAFAMLWVPLGQHAFLDAHWMKVGTFMLPFLLLTAASFSQHSVLSKDPRSLALWLLSAYILHQFEEHWVDLTGAVYAFQGSVNAIVHAATGAPADRPGPLTTQAVFVINTSLVWLVGALAVWQGERRLFTVLAMAAIVQVNAISHIIAGIVFWRYNPGLLTSVVVFFPAAIATFRLLPVRRQAIFASIVWAFLAHVIMVAGMLASTWWGLISPLAYYAALVVWSVLPVFVRSAVATGS
ncbi:MAG: HXXEE domain-containing protein [Pseudomonadota bacterium]